MQDTQGLLKPTVSTPQLVFFLEDANHDASLLGPSMGEQLPPCSLDRVPTSHPSITWHL